MKKRPFYLNSLAIKQGTVKMHHILIVEGIVLLIAVLIFLVNFFGNNAWFPFFMYAIFFLSAGLFFFFRRSIWKAQSLFYWRFKYQAFLLVLASIIFIIVLLFSNKIKKDLVDITRIGQKTGQLNVNK